jgi:carbon storage regulator
MLILTRKIGQEIVIDGRIRVTITSINGERVRVGISAPSDVKVLREEVLIKQQSETAEPTPFICYHREEVACN